MRKFLLSAPLALTLLLSSCTGVDLVPIITTVQQLVATACAIVPTAQTIADILAKGNPALATAEAIAAAICAAVSPHPKAGASGGTTGASVGGVPVQVIVIPNRAP